MPPRKTTPSKARRPSRSKTPKRSRTPKRAPSAKVAKRVADYNDGDSKMPNRNHDSTTINDDNHPHKNSTTHTRAVASSPSPSPLPSPPSSARKATLLMAARMLVCVVGINVGLAMWSLKTERVVKIPYSAAAAAPAPGDTKGELFPSNCFLVFVQCLLAAVLGALAMVAVSVYKGDGGTGVNKSSNSNNNKYNKLESERAAAAAQKSGVVSSSSSSSSSQPTLSTARVVRLVAALGFTSVFTSSLSYAAMRLLPYPVYLAAKMNKMLPVLVVGFLVHRTRYPLKKVLSCLLITVGIILYVSEASSSSSSKKAKTTSSAAAQLNNSNKNKNPHLDVTSPLTGAVLAPLLRVLSRHAGLLLCLLSLSLEGYSYSTQDVLVKTYGWSSLQVMVAVNAAGAAWLLLAMLLAEERPWGVVSGLLLRARSAAGYSSSTSSSNTRAAPPLWSEHIPYRALSTTAAFLQRHPAAGVDIFLLGAFCALGQLFIFTALAWFGAVTVTAITIVRKCNSIALSVLVHGHAVGPRQLAALAVIFVGVIWDGQQSIASAAAAASRAKTARAAKEEPPHVKEVGGKEEKKHR